MIKEFVAITCTLTIAYPAIASELTIGVAAFVKEDAQEPSGESLRSSSLNLAPARVSCVEREWVVVGGVKVRKSDVMTAREAIAYYKEQIAKNPTRAANYGVRAYAWRASGQRDAALKDCAEYVRLAPGESQAFKLRGILRTDEGDLDNAVSDFTKAISLNANDSMTFVWRGVAFRKQNRLDNAIADYSESIRLDPQCADAYLNRGVAHGLKMQSDRAISDFSDAIKIEPRNVGAYNNRGLTFEMLNEYDDAIADFGEAMKVAPNQFAAFTNMAYLRATCPNARYRDGREAIRHATTACELTKWKDWNVVFILATAHAEAGDFASAVKCAERALDMAPEVEWPFVQKQLALLRENKPFREVMEGKRHRLAVVPNTPVHSR